MMKKGFLLLFLVVCFVSVASCAYHNMPTPVSQITAAQTSSLKYENLDCQRLAAEYDDLVKREAALIVAQNQRIKTSEIQAWHKGYGQGDGIEAAELSIVRGELSAIKKVIDYKCSMSQQPTTESD